MRPLLSYLQISLLASLSLLFSFTVFASGNSKSDIIAYCYLKDPETGKFTTIVGEPMIVQASLVDPYQSGNTPSSDYSQSRFSSGTYVVAAEELVTIVRNCLRAANGQPYQVRTATSYWHRNGVSVSYIHSADSRLYRIGEEPKETPKSEENVEGSSPPSPQSEHSENYVYIGEEEINHGVQSVPTSAPGTPTAGGAEDIPAPAPVTLTADEVKEDGDNSEPEGDASTSSLRRTKRYYNSLVNLAETPTVGGAKEGQGDAAPAPLQSGSRSSQSALDPIEEEVEVQVEEGESSNREAVPPAISVTQAIPPARPAARRSAEPSSLPRLSPQSPHLEEFAEPSSLPPLSAQPAGPLGALRAAQSSAASSTPLELLREQMRAMPIPVIRADSLPSLVNMFRRRNVPSGTMPPNNGESSSQSSGNQELSLQGQLKLRNFLGRGFGQNGGGGSLKLE